MFLFGINVRGYLDNTTHLLYRTSHGFDSDYNGIMSVGSESAIPYELQKSRRLAGLSNPKTRALLQHWEIPTFEAVNFDNLHMLYEANSEDFHYVIPSKLARDHGHRTPTPNSTQISTSEWPTKSFKAESSAPVEPTETAFGWLCDGTVYVQGPNHGYCCALDIFVPILNSHQASNGMSGSVCRSQEFDSRRYNSPIEQVDNCTSWRGISVKEARIIFEIHRELIPCIQRLLQNQVKELILRTQLEASVLSVAPRECIPVSISLNSLTNEILATDIQSRVWGGSPSPEHTMELMFLYFISSNCFLNAGTHDADAVVYITLASLLCYPAQPRTLPKIIISEQLDHLSFTEFNAFPYEGHKQLIVPHYRRGSQTVVNSPLRTISYSVGSSTPWLSWDNKLCGFTGVTPRFLGNKDLCEGIAIEVSATLHEHQSCSNVHIKRVVRTRLHLMVLQRYDVDATPASPRTPVDDHAGHDKHSTSQGVPRSAADESLVVVAFEHLSDTPRSFNAYDYERQDYSTSTMSASPSANSSTNPGGYIRESSDLASDGRNPDMSNTVPRVVFYLNRFAPLRNLRDQSTSEISQSNSSSPSTNLDRSAGRRYCYLTSNKMGIWERLKRERKGSECRWKGGASIMTWLEGDDDSRRDTSGRDMVLEDEEDNESESGNGVKVGN